MQVTTSDPKITLEQHTVAESSSAIQQNKQRYIQIKEQREKIFFTPVVDKQANEAVVTELNNQNIYDNLNIATATELVTMLLNLVEKLKLIDNYYCNGNHATDLDNLIAKIINETINEDIILRFRNICYWLSNLVNLLQNLQYQHEFLPETITINKETIALKLQECLVFLDACWDGISSRFAHEYEILSSIQQQNLTGKIFLIRKWLFQNLATQFIDSLEKYKNYSIGISMEIHLYNLLHNAMASQLGFSYIQDNFTPPNFPKAFTKEFIDLATIEVAPANITRILAEQLYQELTACLATVNLQDWLYTPKPDTAFCEGLNSLLENSVFTPANILFNATAERQLNINTIIEDTADKNGELLYSLSNSQEKLHFWVANNLIPDSESILIANIYDQQIQSYVSIASIDYMFFWIVKQDQYQDNATTHNFNKDNYITLNLSHIQQLDSIELANIDINQHLELSCYYKKTEISIALASQALYQTNSALIIMRFFTDATINHMLEESILIAKKLHVILINKLSDNNFRKNFINEINDYYANPSITTITKNEASFFIKYNIFAEVFSIMINNQISIDECFELNSKEVTVVLQLIKNLSLNKLKDILRYGSNYAELLPLLIQANSAKLIYTILISNNNCLDFITENYNAILSVAISNSHLDLINFVLNSNPTKITSHILYEVICYASYTIFLSFTNHIRKHIGLFNKNQLLELLQAKNNNGTPAVVIALKNTNYDTVADYFKFIAFLERLDESDKLSLFKLNYNNETWLSYAQKLFSRADNIASYIQNFINIILNIPSINSTQITEILEAKNNIGNSALFLAMQQPNNRIVPLYIKYIMEAKVLNIEEKFNIIVAECSEGSGLSVLIQNNSYNTINSYQKNVIEKKLFDANQLFKLLQAKDFNGNSGLYVIMNNAMTDNNNIDLLTLYLDFILKNNTLNGQQKFELMLAKNADNTTALYETLSKNQYVSIKYIENIIMSSCFTADQNFELILAKAGDDTNSIYSAIKNNNLNIISQVITSILHRINYLSGNLVDFFIEPTLKYKIYNDCIDLIDKYISFILNNKMCDINQKEDILRTAISYKNYEKLINTSYLSYEAKKKLLDIANRYRKTFS